MGYRAFFSRFQIVFVCVALGLVLGIFNSMFMHKVTQWGHQIPSINIASDYSIALLWALALWVSILIWPVSKEDRKNLLLIWALRCFVTLGLMLIYEDHYGLDAYTYYLDAKEETFNFDQVGFGKGTGNIGLLIWFFNHSLPIGDSYHALKVIFSFIGMMGTFIFYRALVKYTNRSMPKLCLFINLFPSLLFWSSILGKDPIMLFGISLYSWGVLYWIRQRSLIYYLPIALGVLIASSIRPWTAIILIAPLTILGVREVKGTIPKTVYSGIIGASLFLTFQLFIEHFDLLSLEDLVSKTNLISKAWNIGGSSLVVPNFTNVQEMLAFAPFGMFASLFRPLPGEVANMFGTFAGLENLFLLFLLFTAVKKKFWRSMKDPAITWAVSLLLIWSFVYGFVSYQNLGSAFRFRLQVLPLLLTLLLYLSEFRISFGSLQRRSK